MNIHKRIPLGNIPLAQILAPKKRKKAGSVSKYQSVISTYNADFQRSMNWINDMCWRQHVYKCQVITEKLRASQQEKALIPQFSKQKDILEIDQAIKDAKEKTAKLKQEEGFCKHNKTITPALKKEYKAKRESLKKEINDLKTRKQQLLTQKKAEESSRKVLMPLSKILGKDSGSGLGWNRLEPQINRIRDCLANNKELPPIQVFENEKGKLEALNPLIRLAYKHLKLHKVPVVKVDSVRGELKQQKSENDKKLRKTSNLPMSVYVPAEKDARTAKWRPRYTGTGRFSIEVENKKSPFRDKKSVRPFYISDLYTPNRRFFIETIKGSRTSIFHANLGKEGETFLFPINHMNYLRKLTPTDVIKSCDIVKKRKGAKYLLEVQLVVETSQSFPKSKPKSVGIDLGWSMQGTGLRVGYWSGDDGQHGDIILPDYIRKGFKKVNELKSTRESEYKKIKLILKDIWKMFPEDSWFREEFKTIGSQKSIDRLRKAIFKWRKEETLRTVPHFDEALKWAKHDQHLYQWERNNESKAVLARKHFFHEVVKDLQSKGYNVVGFEKINWANISRAKIAGGQRKICAPATLRSICKEKFQHYIEVDPKNTSRTCVKCKSQVVWNKDTYKNPICSHCGNQIDRDLQGAKNILTKTKLGLRALR